MKNVWYSKTAYNWKMNCLCSMHGSISWAFCNTIAALNSYLSVYLYHSSVTKCSVIGVLLYSQSNGSLQRSPSHVSEGCAVAHTLAAHGCDRLCHGGAHLERSGPEIWAWRGGQTLHGDDGGKHNSKDCTSAESSVVGTLHIVSLMWSP